MQSEPSYTGPATFPAEVPGYEFVREVHRGSQGVVYEAIQRATRRTVAIKLIADGLLAGPQARARFQREIQILASLRHANIVTIHDSGAVTGSFYYVMDYIAGSTLDSYCQAAALSINKTVELFAKVCDGLNAAHLRGVIHRDLKPRNVLIDERGEPIVIDFGLAKPLAAETVGGCRAVSQTGEFLGSLPWASPEQAEADPARIDIRSDVYALGVILYQLLTGRFPYAIDAGVRQVLQNIAEADPTPPRTLRPEIGEDLQIIVLTALQKQPAHRYQSAGELATDLRRYLADEPILARGDSTAYILWKKVKKYRAPVAAAVSITVLAACFTTALFVVRQRSREAERRGAAIQLAFMERALTALEPGYNGQLPTGELEAIATRVETELAGYPSIQGPLLERIGNVFRRLGLLDAAKPYLERAVQTERSGSGEPTADYASALRSLAGLCYDQADYARAASLYGEALEIRRRLFGEDHALVAEVTNDLAACFNNQGHYVQAEELYRKTLQVRRALLGEDQPDTAASRNNLAGCLVETGKYVEAEALYRHALASVQNPAAADALKGEDRPQFIARAQTSLACALVEQGKFGEARELLRESLGIKDRLIGRENSSTATTLAWLARVELGAGDLDAAETLAKEALAIRVAMLGAKHPHVAVSQQILGETLLAQGDIEGARAHLSEAYEIQSKTLPAHHWRRANSASLLGECLHRLGRYEEAGPLLVDSLPIIRSTRGDSDRYTQLAAYRLVSHYETMGKAAEASQYRALLLPNFVPPQSAQLQALSASEENGPAAKDSER